MDIVDENHLYYYVWSQTNVTLTYLHCISKIYYWIDKEIIRNSNNKNGFFVRFDVKNERKEAVVDNMEYGVAVNEHLSGIP